jgi:hypothetical protein
MRDRVIREAILEAHQNVEKYGGVWYVLNSDGFDVVKESYFINEDGTRKHKPFISLYNTDDKFYGNYGIGHGVEFVDGDLKFTSSWDDPKWDDFEQPYGEKLEEEPYERGIMPMGVVGHGSTISMASLIARSGQAHVAKLQDVLNLGDDVDENGITTPKLDGTRKLFVVENFDFDGTLFDKIDIQTTRFDMKTGKIVEDKYHRPISETKRKELRNKRKKRNK